MHARHWARGSSCHHLSPAPLPLQTEELLSKRRDLLEKKIAAELERAKVFLKQNNKRGEAARHSAPCCCMHI